MIEGRVELVARIGQRINPRAEVASPSSFESF
jgi:hypothetical protein